MEADRSAATTATSRSTAWGTTSACAATATTGQEQRTKPTATTATATPCDARLTCSAGSAHGNRVLAGLRHQSVAADTTSTTDTTDTTDTRATVRSAVRATLTPARLSTAAIRSVAGLAATATSTAVARTAAAVTPIGRHAGNASFGHAAVVRRNAAIATVAAVDRAALDR